jgi:hypothetical protein
MKNLCIGIGVLLSLAIPAGWPYDFKILLRWIITISSVIVACNFYKPHLYGWSTAFVTLAILFNPIFPIYLQKSNWVGIDLVFPVLFFLPAYSVNSNIKR